MRNRIALILSLLILARCNDGGGESAFSGEYDGVWDVRYNLTEDSCEIVESGVTGFVDVQNIFQNEGAITLESSVGFGETFSGTLDANNELLSSQSISGDIYQDGGQCQVQQSISYSPTSDDRADTLFKRDVSCADGYVCSSRAIGAAIRR